ncbi:MAG: exodeoxyribonuclease VII small subunit [Clostridiales Family XIII bacterium]|nr:exodeoxyribonuclease VII small subunit [Clostridiales Family XIII bacterium]
MTEKKKITFEEAYSKLEECSRTVSRESMTLDETIGAFEEGVKYYNLCAELLDSAEQRIMRIDKETEEPLDV